MCLGTIIEGCYSLLESEAAAKGKGAEAVLPRRSELNRILGEGGQALLVTAAARCVRRLNMRTGTV